MKKTVERIFPLYPLFIYSLIVFLSLSLLYLTEKATKQETVYHLHPCSWPLEPRKGFDISQNVVFELKMCLKFPPHLLASEMEVPSTLELSLSCQTLDGSWFPCPWMNLLSFSHLTLGFLRPIAVSVIYLSIHWGAMEQ